MSRDAAPEVVAGSLHNHIANASRDTVHGFRVLPGLIKSILENDEWRKLIRPVDGKLFVHESIESWILGEPWAGLHYPSWDALYAVLERAEDGDEVIKMLVARGAPVSAVAADTKPARAKAGRPSGNVDNIHIRPSGTSEARTVARLKRDAPDLAQEVISGRLSANAAAIKAGFRKPSLTVPLDPERLARAVRRHFTPEEIQRLVRALMEH